MPRHRHRAGSPGRTPRRRTGRRRPFRLVGLLGVPLLALPGALPAQLTILQGDGPQLSLAGYVRSLTGIHDRGFDVPGLDREHGFHAQVLRLKWRLETGSAVVDVHSRLQGRVSSSAVDAPVAGLGVSAVPARSVDLATDLVARDRFRLWHDVDRLSVTLRTAAADVTFGRQPITWGGSMLFPVADLWAQFSPFELDTEEKPGIDAARALFYPATGLEMDVIVADRGSLEDLSAGARASFTRPGADAWVGAGKFWRQAMIMGGAVVPLDETSLRAEVVLPWDLDDRKLQKPRATLGMDWIRARFVLTGEYHYNGIGAPGPEAYFDQLQDPRFARGESYFLGRHYLGGLALWRPDVDGRLSLAINALLNVRDGSAAFTPILSYDIGQTTSASLGALLSLGERPVIAFPPELRSEFGTYGRLGFTRISVYF